jgi:hypothetical protein
MAEQSNNSDNELNASGIASRPGQSVDGNKQHMKCGKQCTLGAALACAVTVRDANGVTIPWRGHYRRLTALAMSQALAQEPLTWQHGAGAARCTASTDSRRPNGWTAEDGGRTGGIGATREHRWHSLRAWLRKARRCCAIAAPTAPRHAAEFQRLAGSPLLATPSAARPHRKAMPGLCGGIGRQTMHRLPRLRTRKGFRPLTMQSSLSMMSSSRAEAGMPCTHIDIVSRDAACSTAYGMYGAAQSVGAAISSADAGLGNANLAPDWHSAARVQLEQPYKRGEHPGEGMQHKRPGACSPFGCRQAHAATVARAPAR